MASDTLDELERHVAIIGMACRVAGANTVEQFWENVKSGKTSLAQLSEDELRAAGVPEKLIDDPAYVRAGMFVDDPRGFDAGFFGFSPRDARLLDPQHRHLLEISWEALEDGGYDPFAYAGSIGVFAGSGHNAYMPYNLLSNPELVDEVGFFLLRHTGNDKDFLPSRISYNFNLRGPSMAIQTACSTSLVCVHAATQSLISGECDMALAGGMTINLPLNHGYLYEEGGITSNDGHCRAFDAASTGTILGSGGGVVLLKRLEDAIEDGDRIHGVVVGSAVNNDGSSKVNYLAPSVDGQAAAISEAIEVAGIEPASVGFIECHGTGTKIGDPIEIAALNQAYGYNNDKKGYCAIGSVKSNIGHTDTAAGILGLIKAVMSVKTATLTPTVHYSSPNPEIDFANSPFYVNKALGAWQSDSVRRAAVNSLGVGGTNAHVIIEEAPDASARQTRPWNIVALSAKTKTALANSQQRLRDHFERCPGENLSDCEYTLLRGREAMRHRCVAVVGDHADALEALSEPKSERWSHMSAPEAKGRVVFMYAGGGAQHPNMGRDLYETQPVFRQALDDCARRLAPFVDYDLLELMFPDADNYDNSATEMQRPTRSLPCLFSMQYAQSMLWLSMGIEPEALIGHSMGENTALCVAGGISLAEALSLVATRGRLQEAAPEGGMVSVFAAPGVLQKYLKGDLSISVFNGPELCVVSGPVEDLAQLQKTLDQDDIENQRVRINVAAHSKFLDPVLPEFKRHLEGFNYQSLNIPIASTFSGAWLKDEQAVSADYWVDQLRNPVRFDDAIKLLLETDADRMFLEVGPGNVLSSLVKQQPLAKEREVMGSSPHRDADINQEAFMLSTLGKIWAANGSVDWERYFEGRDVGRIGLPTYPFEHREHWVEPGDSHSAGIGSAEARLAPDQWYYQPGWQLVPAPAADGALGEGAGAVVLGSSAAAVRIATELKNIDCPVALHDFPSNPDALKTLLSSTAERHPRGLVVVHASALEPNSLDRAGLDATFFSLWDTVAAIAELEVEGVRLAVLGDRTLKTVPGENLPGAIGASMLGTARVVPKEFPSVTARFIDTDLGADLPSGILSATSKMIAADIVDNASAEFRSAAWTRASTYPRCGVVSYRMGQRYEETVARVSALAFDTGLSEKVTGKHVIITGGLGGLGLDAAQFLAKQGCAHISLIGRSGLPPREDWPSHLHQDTRMARRIKGVMALEDIGVGVSIHVADVTDAVSVQSAHQAARDAGGPVTGILHTAGTLDDQLLQLKARDDAEAVVAPKVIGAVNMVEACKQDPLEFIVFYSSVSAYLGAPGQADYAAANAFLDSYANSLASEGLPAMSINWPIWQDVGMAADLAAGRKTAGSSFAVFEPRLNNGSYEVCLSTADWILNEHRTRSGLAVVPGTALVELVYSAHRARADAEESNSGVSIRDMTLFAPITVRDGDRLVGAVQLGERGADGEFEITSAPSPAAAAQQEWAGEHVQGRISDEQLERPEPLDLAGLTDRLDAYPEIAAAGIESPFMAFGDRWNCMKSYASKGQEMFAELELPDQYITDLETHALHPALLDNAIAGLQSVRHHRDHPGEFLIPMSYGRISVFAELPQRVVSHVVEQSIDAQDQRAFDITVCDPNGNVLIAVERFVMKVGDAKSLDLAAATDDRSVVDMDFSGGISTREGQGILSTLVGNPIHSQILVSPADFAAAMKKASRFVAPVVEEKSDEDALELSSEYAAPETDAQRQLCEIWKKGLGLNRIGVHDNFFELGGHSLLLTQLASRMKKELKAAPKTSQLFGSPTIAAWAQFVETAEASPEVTAPSAKPIKRVSRDAYRRAGS